MTLPVDWDGTPQARKILIRLARGEPAFPKPLKHRDSSFRRGALRWLRDKGYIVRGYKRGPSVTAAGFAALKPRDPDAYTPHDEAILQRCAREYGYEAMSERLGRSVSGIGNKLCRLRGSQRNGNDSRLI